MNTLITGGTGFIGSRLALRLLAQGHFVRVLAQANTKAETENSSELEEAGVEVVLASVTNKEAISTVLKDIDFVFHLAAAQHEANVPDQLFWDVNVMGTKNVLEASAANNVKRFVHGSTIGVYGSAMEGEIDEQTPIRPDNIYGVTKSEAEKEVISFLDQLPVVIVRISETYGPGDRRLLKLFRAIKKNMFFMIGNGQNIHHPIYIEDLIDGLLLASKIDEAVGQTINLTGYQSITTNELVTTIAEEVGGNVRFRAPMFPFLVISTVMEAAFRPLGIQPPLHPRRMDFFKKSFFFSTEFEYTILGFTPRYDFKSGVSETAKWYIEKGYL